MLAGGSGGGAWSQNVDCDIFPLHYLSIWKAHYAGGPSSKVFFYLFLGIEQETAKLRWAGGAQRPVWRGDEPKKTGARSARARTRGQNPLVLYINR